MHRRSRHLNPAHAGATMALDSRFITGVSSGTGLQTWSSRSRATESLTQATSARRPIYTLGLSGGQPGVVFTSASQHWMIRSGAIISATLSRYSIITCGAVAYTQTSDNTFLGAYASAFFTLAKEKTVYLNVVIATPASSVRAESLSGSQAITQGGRSGANTIFARDTNGIRATASGGGSSVDLSTTRNSSTPDGYYNGTHYAVSVFLTDISDSLANRIMHSYILSFKII